MPELEAPQLLLVVLAVNSLPFQSSRTVMVNTLVDAITDLSAALACGGTPQVPMRYSSSLYIHLQVLKFVGCTD
jgi:hypothetical protein